MALAIACAAVLWLTRYEYVGAERATIIRVNRWTGSTAILTRSAWRPIAPAPAKEDVDPLDSLARAVGVQLP